MAILDNQRLPGSERIDAAPHITRYWTHAAMRRWVVMFASDAPPIRVTWNFEGAQRTHRGAGS